MGKYTKSKAVGIDLDGFVEENLNIIVNQIKKEIEGLKAIILMGGYGRGEGAVEIHNGKPRLINDFDMYVITERQLPDDFLESVALKCSKLIGKGGIAHPEGFEKRYNFEEFFHVDIRCIPEKRLPLLPPTVRYFEMRNTSTVLYGDKKILEKLPKISPEDIPKSEALRLIMNRMMLLIMSFSSKFILKRNYMTEDEHGIMVYYIGKSYLTAAEALLIFSGDFKPTYSERAVVFEKIYKKKYPELYEKIPDLPKKVKFFTNYKSKPDPKKVQAIDEWFVCREILGTVFRTCLEKFLKRKLPNNWIEICNILKNELPYPYFEPYARYFLRKFKIDFYVFRRFTVNLIQLYMNFKYFQKLRKDINRFYWPAFTLKDQGIRILYITPLVLYSIERNGKSDVSMIDKALKELKKSYLVTLTTDWEKVKSYYLKAYRLYYLQRFV